MTDLELHEQAMEYYEKLTTPAQRKFQSQDTRLYLLLGEMQRARRVFAAQGQLAPTAANLLADLYGSVGECLSAFFRAATELEDSKNKKETVE